MNVVVTHENICELSNLVRFAAALGVRRVLVNRLRPAGVAQRNMNALAVSRAAFDLAVDAARQVAIDSGIDLIGVSPPSTPGPRSTWHRLALTPDGQLKLCNQSSKTLGAVADLEASDLCALALALDQGRVDEYRQSVDHCYCL